jgi:hypothetical protein
VYAAAATAGVDHVRRSYLGESRTLRFSSPLFSHLIRMCAQDEDMLTLGTYARPGESNALLLLMSAHYLILRSGASPVAAYFPSAGASVGDVQRAYPDFRAFCLDHRDELIELLATRTVNTNLVDRTACIWPALRHVASRARAPMTLIEIGCSAGLNLLFDSYSYSYPDTMIDQAKRAASAPLLLTCIVLSGRLGCGDEPEISRRIGIDLVGMNTADPADRLWLEAVLCPEWIAERERLRAAMRIAAHERQVQKIVGDALQLLPDVLAQINEPVCVLNSHCLSQWPAEKQHELERVLVSHGARGKPVHRLSFEPIATEAPHDTRARLLKMARRGVNVLDKSIPSTLDYKCYESGRIEHVKLGQADGFGKWIDWNEGSSAR